MAPLRLSVRSYTVFNPTPNPPDTDPASPYESLDSKKLTKPPIVRAGGDVGGVGGESGVG
jgi:hypothetical protein